LIEHHTKDSTLPGEIVWTYRRDPQGRLYAGTNRCLARAAAGLWECVPGTEGRNVRAIAFPAQGGIYLGGGPSDLPYLDRHGRQTSIGEAGQLDLIYALALDPLGDLWIVTRSGLYRLPHAVPGPLVPVHVPGIRDRAQFGSVLVVGEQLWITAAPGGVAVHDQGTWKLFDQTSGLRSSSPSYLVARGDGRLCTMYTEALGVTCFRYDTGHLVEIAHIGAPEGLTTGKVYFLGEDLDHRLWIGTGFGVNVLTPRGMDHFDDSDGLAGNDSASQSLFLDSDGSLWLGATGGGSPVLPPFSPPPPPPPPP